MDHVESEHDGLLIALTGSGGRSLSRVLLDQLNEEVHDVEGSLDAMMAVIGLKGERGCREEQVLEVRVKVTKNTKG